MGVIASSINDGDGRYGSRTRVNRLVYEFTNADLASQTSATADVNLNGKIHNIIIDATRCTVGSGTTTGSFQLLAADLTDGAGTPALYSYHNEISFMDVIKWTGLVCGTVRLKVATSSAWGAGTGSLFVTLIYD